MRHVCLQALKTGEEVFVHLVATNKLQTCKTTSRTPCALRDRWRWGHRDTCKFQRKQQLDVYVYYHHGTSFKNIQECKRPACKARDVWCVQQSGAATDIVDSRTKKMRVKDWKKHFVAETRTPYATHSRSEIRHTCGYIPKGWKHWEIRSF